VLLRMMLLLLLGWRRFMDEEEIHGFFCGFERDTEKWRRAESGDWLDMVMLVMAMLMMLMVLVLVLL
jgi:hypothetical protein